MYFVSFVILCTCFTVFYLNCHISNKTFIAWRYSLNFHNKKKSARATPLRKLQTDIRRSNPSTRIPQLCYQKSRSSNEMTTSSFLPLVTLISSAFLIPRFLHANSNYEGMWYISKFLKSSMVTFQP